MRPIVASDLMTPDVLTVRDEMTVAELANFLLENEISGAAVTDRQGKLVGVVSVVDIAAAAADEGEVGSDSTNPEFYLQGWEDSVDEDELEDLHIEVGGAMVRDIMSPAIYSVAADARVSEVARTMLNGHIHRLLVMQDDEVVGIITTSDLLGLLVDEED